MTIKHKYYLQSGSLRVVRIAESGYIAAIETIHDYYNNKWNNVEKILPGKTILVQESGFKIRPESHYEVYSLEELRKEIQEEF